MRAAVPLLAFLSCALLPGAEDPRRLSAPSYSVASIVNSATNEPGAFAPNTIISIYGQNLAFDTKAISAADIDGILLPTMLAGTGVTVLVGNIPAIVYFVSPGQVNVLIPNNLRPIPVRLQLTRDGRAGPAIPIVLRQAAPALFPLDATTAIATRADGTVVSWDHPARPGEIVVLYATGLGPTNPNPVYRHVPSTAAWIERLDEFELLLDGVRVDPGRIAYAGLTPGFAGLYQINLYLPEDTPVNPEIRIAIGEHRSPGGAFLPVSVSTPDPPAEF
ncbi:MAG: hypothetical protein GY953_50175 [bacterium]|nr:hypothetical protein [bacterium]